MNSLEKANKLEEIRTKLSGLREEIAKLRRDDKLWEGWLLPCEGGITCVLTASHGAVEELKRHHKKWGIKK
jgi:hypothetical protein